MIEQGQEKKKVAALYVRVSTGKQDAENQLLALRPYCEKSGYLIGHEYMDIVSGAEDNRPAFNQLFKDAHQHKFDILIFWALDRFSRSGMAFTVQKLQELKNLGIDWDSFQEPYIKTIGPFGDVVMVLMATLARVERERLSERTKAGLARKRATGWVPGRKKGVKDKKPRRRKGYYDNHNRQQSNKGVSAEQGENAPLLIRYGRSFENKQTPVISGSKTEVKGEEELRGQ
jgi:DNA invertase Pin-like site-specific DNA recombinase